MANPRIDDLRKKLDKEPASRLFAQLAEELRKEGDLAEAIRIARQGLAQHPAYPSARMTLGRALLDSGDLAAARTEFETVLKGAADNILASRYLAECLEGQGESAEALARYRATLALAPGDRQVQARIQELEKAASARVAAPAAAPPPPPATEVEEEPPPIRLVEIEGPMELVTRYEEAAPRPPAPAEDIFFEEPQAGPVPVVAPEKNEAPVPLVPVDEMEFELERPYETPPVVVRSVVEAVPAPPAPGIDAEPVVEPERAEPVLAEPLEAEPVVSEPEPMVLEPDVIDEEFDVEPAPAAGPPRVTFRDELLIETRLAREEVLETPAQAAAPAPPSDLARPAPAAAPATLEPELASPTLAELYYDQGVPEKAAEVYRRLLQRDPDNERLRGRLQEIEASVQKPSPAEAPPGAEEALGRAIARLEELRSVLARRE